MPCPNPFSGPRLARSVRHSLGRRHENDVHDAKTFTDGYRTVCVRDNCYTSPETTDNDANVDSDDCRDVTSLSTNL